MSPIGLSRRSRIARHDPSLRGVLDALLLMTTGVHRGPVDMRLQPGTQNPSRTDMNRAAPEIH
jgi:hypothetical protein